MAHKQIPWYGNGRPGNGAGEIGKAGEKAKTKLSDIVLTHSAYRKTTEILCKLFSKRFKIMPLEAELAKLATSKETSEIFKEATNYFIRTTFKAKARYLDPSITEERLQIVRALLSSRSDAGTASHEKPNKDLAYALVGAVVAGNRPLHFEKHLMDFIRNGKGNADLVTAAVASIKSLDIEDAGHKPKAFVDFVCSESAAYNIKKIELLVETVLDAARPSESDV